MPSPTATATIPFALQKANAARAYYSLDRAIRRALEAQSPPDDEQRRALAALLLDGIGSHR